MIGIPSESTEELGGRGAGAGAAGGGVVEEDIEPRDPEPGGCPWEGGGEDRETRGEGRIVGGDSRAGLGEWTLDWGGDSRGRCEEPWKRAVVET